MAQVPIYGGQTQDIGRRRGGELRQTQQPTVGAGLEDLGHSVLQIGAAFKKAEDSRTLNNEVTAATKSLEDFKASQRSDPDSFADWEKQHEEFTQKTLEDARERMNKRVFDSFSATYKNMALRSHVNTVNASRKILADKGRADLDSNLSTYNDLYATQADPEERKVVLGQALLSISDAQNSGFISEEAAGETRRAFLESVETTRLENDINLDPEVAQVNFESGEYAIPEEKKPAIARRLETTINSIKRERNTTLEKNERRQEKLLKQAQDDTEIDFIDLMLNDELTERKVIEAGQSRQLRPQQVSSLLSDLQKEDNAASDPQEYVDTLEAVLAGQMTVDQVLSSALSVKDKKTFTGMISRAEDEEQKDEAKKLNEDEKRITAAIKPFIISTGPLAAFVKQDEQILLQSAIEEMRLRLNEGEDPDKIKLDIIKRYNRVPLSVEQLPKLRYGDATNLQQAEQLLVDNFRKNRITASQANMQAELIQKYRDAIRNQKALEQINKDSNRGRK